MPVKSPIQFCIGFFICIFFYTSCQPNEKKEVHKKVDYIRKINGPSDSIPLRESRRGEVLIAYSDCYECHTKEKRAKGPAFMDIAKRYPVNKGYIKLLSLRVIKGGEWCMGQFRHVAASEIGR